MAALCFIYCLFAYLQSAVIVRLVDVNVCLSGICSHFTLAGTMTAAPSTELTNSYQPITELQHAIPFAFPCTMQLPFYGYL